MVVQTLRLSAPSYSGGKKEKEKQRCFMVNRLLLFFALCFICFFLGLFLGGGGCSSPYDKLMFLSEPGRCNIM